MTGRVVASGIAIAVLCASAAASAQLRDPTHETKTAPVPGMTPATSLCRISTDETYGLTLANPVKTGGGDMTPDGSKKHGIVTQVRMVLIATPLTCGAETILPETVALIDGLGNAAPSLNKATGDGIAALSPGLPPTAGAIAVVYSVPNLIAGARTTTSQNASWSS